MSEHIPFVPDLLVKPEVTGFFDDQTNTISYVVKDPASAACAIMDSVMDIDYAAGRITHERADSDDRACQGATGSSSNG